MYMKFALNYKQYIQGDDIESQRAEATEETLDIPCGMVVR